MSATVELWRIAEQGDVDELAAVLARGVDVDARNKYGMTALMRAAYRGDERMVRALLDHGADPNLARNDRFTALALAAFFGHTETVKTLVERGARKEIVTRCGTSAYMWARARTFEEAARCLESRAPRKALECADLSALSPKRRKPAVEQSSISPVVRTLKEPPEIWDLVHEAPRSFNPRVAFVSRLKSMGASFALRAAVIVLASVASVVGVLVLRGSQARSLLEDSDQSAIEVNASAFETVPTPVVEASASSGPSNNAPVEAPVNSHHSPEAPEEKGKVGDSRQLNMLTRQSRSRFTPSVEAVENSETIEAPAAPTATVATPQFESRSSPESSPAKPKAETSLNPQLITPTKTGQRKGKVIQWP